MRPIRENIALICGRKNSPNITVSYQKENSWKWNISTCAKSEHTQQIDIAHIRKYLLHEYHISAASWGQVCGSCMAGLGSLAVALGSSMSKTLLFLQSFMGVHTICKKILYNLQKIRVQKNCAFFFSSFGYYIHTTGPFHSTLFKWSTLATSEYFTNLQLSELSNKLLSLFV